MKQKETKKPAPIPTLPDAKGKDTMLAVGCVIESTDKRARGPLLVFAEEHAKVGEDTLIEFGLADKNSVMLSMRYTAYQLARFGYRIIKTVPADKVAKMKFAKPDAEVSFEIVERAGNADGKETVVTPKLIKTEEGKKREKIIVAIAEKLDGWAWGVQPDNYEDIEKEILGLGVTKDELNKLADGITNLIAELASAVAVREVK